MGIRDTRMIAKAVEQRWQIKPEYRAALVRRLVQVIADPASSPREVTAASRALISAEGQNQADEQHSDRMDEGRNRVLEFVARIDAGDVPRIADARGTGKPDEGTGAAE